MTKEPMVSVGGSRFQWHEWDARPLGAETEWTHPGLAVLEGLIAGPLEVAVIGEPGCELHRRALAGTSPGLAVAVGPAGSQYPQLLRDRPAIAGQPTAYVCRDFVCELPTTDPDTLRAQVR